MFRLFFIAIFLLPVSLVSQEMDDASNKALEQTIQLLNNPSQRNKEVQEDKAAMKANSFAGEIAGSPENLDKIYELSSKIFSRVTKQNKGDVDSMNSVVDNAKRDPSSFAKGLTDEERVMLKQIADQIKGGKSGFNKH